MRNALLPLLSLLWLVPGAAQAKDDGFTTDEEVLDGKAPAGSRPKAKKKADGSAPTLAGELPQGPLVVVIVPKDPGSTETATAFEAAVAKYVENDGRLQSVDLLKALGGEPKRAETPPAAVESFKKGKDAYDNLDPEGAAKEFMEGLKVLAEDPIAAQPAKIARALTWVGASHLINGDNAKAGDSFTRAFVMSPSYVPDPNEFSPDILAAFKEAKDKVSAGPKGDVTVSSNTAPTYVSVDEVDRGVAPVTIKGLAAGRHHVVVKCRGHQPWATFVDVPGGGGTTAAADLKTLPEADRFRKAVEIAQTELKETKPAFGVQELAAALGARHVVIGVASSAAGAGATIELVAFDVAARRRATGLKKDLMASAATFPSDSQMIATRIVDDLLRNDPIGAGPTVPVTSQSWFWPVIGGVGAALVAGAVAGVVMATLPEGHKSGLTITGIP
ncbi:MAG TPA: PEGA domain-containing protein [Myxococcales bacterium]|jgi:phosphoglycolate phosphatase-like HAD superfamily hydrolase